MIPHNIERSHVLKALKEIDSSGLPAGRASTKYVLSYEGREYPPKFVVALANRFANDFMLESSRFSGGRETNGFLGRLGFEIERITGEEVKSPVSFAETTTGTGVAASRKARRDIMIATEPREETIPGRVDELVSVLREIPWSAWERIVEWPEMAPIYEHLGFARFSVFLAVAGLNDYQLKGRAETAYWPPLSQLLLRSEPSNSPERLLTLLDPFYAQERLGNRKRLRLARFLRSPLARRLWIGTPTEVAGDFAGIWRELASLMGQRRSAKTIAFAMKCLGWSLLMSGERSFDFASVPIPVDSRVRRFMERVGISFGNSEGAVQRGWEQVLASLREVMPRFTMLHLDTLIWEIGTRPLDEILIYFENLGLPELGGKVTLLLEGDKQGSAPF